jgi:hypothetical protein
MSILRKLLAASVLVFATFANSTDLRAQEDCYLWCAGMACNACGSCTGSCWLDTYFYCTEYYCED